MRVLIAALLWVCACQAAAREIDRDGLSNVVRQIGECDQAAGGHQVGGPLKDVCAGGPGRSYGCTVVARDKIPKLVFDPNHRLLREESSRNGGRRRCSRCSMCSA